MAKQWRWAGGMLLRSGLFGPPRGRRRRSGRSATSSTGVRGRRTRRLLPARLATGWAPVSLIAESLPHRQRGGSQLCTSLGGSATLRTVSEFLAVRRGLVNGGAARRLVQDFWALQSPSFLGSFSCKRGCGPRLDSKSSSFLLHLCCMPHFEAARVPASAPVERTVSLPATLLLVPGPSPDMCSVERMKCEGPDRGCCNYVRLNACATEAAWIRSWFRLVTCGVRRYRDGP